MLIHFSEKCWKNSYVVIILKIVSECLEKYLNLIVRKMQSLLSFLFLFMLSCLTFHNSVFNICSVHCQQQHHCVKVLAVQLLTGAVCSCQLVTVKQTSVTKKKDSLRAMALDSDNNQIQVKDVVKVVDGPHSVSFHVVAFSLVLLTAVTFIAFRCVTASELLTMFTC